MEEYPKTLAELESQFSTDQNCIEYLARLRWPNGFECSKCGSEKFWLRKRGLWKCADCRRETSVKAGTIFQGSRLSLTAWFRIIWWVVSQKNGASAKGLQRVLGFGSYETAWTSLQKLRRIMVRPGRDQLHGTVEVDEIFIGGKKSGKRGRGAEGKALVVIAAEKDGKRIGRIRLKRVVDASGESLEPSVQQAIETGSTVHTDGWKGYNGLKLLDYIHEIIRKDASIGENLLPCCNRVAALIKRWILGTHQGSISQKHLDYYLDEFTFRFNRRTSRYRGKLFYRLIQQAVAIKPVPYASLIKPAKKHNI